MTTKTQDFGTVTFEGRIILLTSNAELAGAVADGDDFKMAASGFCIDDSGRDRRCKVIWWFEDKGLELDEYDYDDVYDVELEELDETCDVTAVGAYIFGGWQQAHYAATLALFALAGGHNGPQTRLKLAELQAELQETHTPQEVVNEFRKRGNKA